MYVQLFVLCGGRSVGRSVGQPWRRLDACIVALVDKQKSIQRTKHPALVLLLTKACAVTGLLHLLHALALDVAGVVQPSSFPPTASEFGSVDAVVRAVERLGATAAPAVHPAFTAGGGETALVPPSKVLLVPTWHSGD